MAIGSLCLLIELNSHQLVSLDLLITDQKGTKSIPLYSITATQFKEAGLLTAGYLQFTITGGKENRGGVLAAATDENTFSFLRKEGNNQTVKRIKDYIESKIRELRQPVAQAPAFNVTSVSDELRKLAELKSQGVLSEQEFQAAKQRLLA